MNDPYFSRLLAQLTAPGAGYAKVTAPVTAPRADLAAAGQDADLFDLRIGELRYPLPELVGAALGRAASSAKEIWYSRPVGEPVLQSAYLEHLLHAPELPERDAVLVTGGGKEAAWLALRYLSQNSGPGHHDAPALVPVPGWEPYRLWLGAACKPQIFYDPVALAGDPELLDRLIATSPAAPGLLVLNYPNNPTGAAITQDGMNRIVEIAAERGLAIVSDEVYRSFAAGNVSAAHAPARDPKRHFVVDSCSKALTVAGLRVGFLLADPGAVWELTAFRSAYASCTSVLNQTIAVTLLTNASAIAWLAEVRAAVDRDRRATVAALAEHGIAVSSHGGLYIWCPGPTPGDLVPQQAGDHRVLLTTGGGFGAPGHVRLCTARADLDPVAAAAAVATTLRGR